MRYLFSVISGYLGILLSPALHADTITNGRDGYSFEFARGWTVEKSEREFRLSHPDGSSFIGLIAELPPDVQSLRVAGLILRASALAAGFCRQKTTNEFDLEGPDWSGHGFHCDNVSADRGVASQTIGLAAKRGQSFYHFVLFVPRQDWETNSHTYLALLGSLRFLDRSVEKGKR